MISDRAEDTTVEAAGPTAASAFLRFDLLEEVVACAALVVFRTGLFDRDER